MIIHKSKKKFLYSREWDEIVPRDKDGMEVEDCVELFKINSFGAYDKIE